MASYLCLARRPVREEGGDDVKSAWLLRLGLHTRYNDGRNAQRPGNGQLIAKDRPSADWGLQLAPMKAELLVTAYQRWRGEYVPGPCTHRPSRHGSCQRLKSVGQPAREAAAEGWGSDWDEVVTR